MLVALLTVVACALLVVNTQRYVESCRLKAQLRLERARIDVLTEVLEEVERYSKDNGIKNLARSALGRGDTTGREV